MKHRIKKGTVIAALSALLCVPVALGALAGCANDGGEIEQSATKDSAALSFVSVSDVTLLDDYGSNAESLEVGYLLQLDSDKLLYWFHKNAGLSPKASGSYSGGWEGSLIGGHTMGHYLTALAQAYANANTDSEDKELLKAKIDYIVAELKTCQDNAVNAGSEEGFLWGAKTISSSNYEIQFDNVEAGKTNIASQAWVPWYTMHKIIAGLIDLYTVAGNETALDVAKSLGDWVYNRVSKWSASTQKTVLNIEYGGMNDCMYNLYALTGEEKYAVAAHMFDEETLFDKVIAGTGNYLVNLHANTTIPKIIGALNRYVTLDGKTLDGETVDASRYLETAENFWAYVVEHHTYITGGSSEDEHFGNADILNGTGYSGRDNTNCETCNSYNMLKLSRMLFSITGEKKYLDFYENTYINAILSSQNPETGMTTYFQPMATGYFKVYSTEDTNFWCCTGSGMESFSKLNDSIYYTAGNALYVAMYFSSVYERDGLKITQTADLETSDTITFAVDSGSTVLRLRVPDWTTKFEAEVNGNPVAVSGDEDFVSVDVKKGDTVTVTTGKEVVAYGLPDAENLYAFKWGPYVLSAEYGEVTSSDRTASHGVSVSVPAVKDLGEVGTETLNVEEGTVSNFIANINEHMVANGDGTFTLQGCDTELTYSLHFRQYTHRYGIYLYFAGADVEIVDDSTYTVEEIDAIQPGYGQYEVDAFHNMQDNGSVGTTSDADAGGSSRYAEANGSFSYRLAVDKSADNNYLIVRLSTYDAGKSIKIVSGSTVIFEETLRYGLSDSAYTVKDGVYERMIPIPASVVASATSVTSGGETRDMITITVSSGKEGEKSARLHTSIQTALVSFKEEAQNANYTASSTSSSVLYFVDCGDYDASTVSAGDAFGKYNSVTEQLYGIDLVTGKYWGLVDGSDPATGSAGSESANGISSANTWAYEFNTGDGLSKTASNRYTKNQWETSSSETRYLAYLFELEDGTYDVTFYLSDPWGCSKNVTVTANGEQISASTATGQAITKQVTVSGGCLLLEFSNTDATVGLAVNVAYITISQS